MTYHGPARDFTVHLYMLHDAIPAVGHSVDDTGRCNSCPWGRFYMLQFLVHGFLHKVALRREAPAAEAAAAAFMDRMTL